MRRMLVTALALALGLTVTACEKTIEPPQPKTGTMTSPLANQSLPAAARSTKDPSVPPADAALAGQPKEGTQDTALTQKEIRKDQPLPGQANDHSNDAFAKRGDNTQEKTN